MTNDAVRNTRRLLLDHDLPAERRNLGPSPDLDVVLLRRGEGNLFL